MSRFLQALQSGAVLMDGAMGTELQKLGRGPGECGELWNLTRPDAVRSVSEAYAAAGAAYLLTNTFQANPVALERFGERERLKAICRAGVELARAAAGPGRFVVADVGPVMDAGGEEFVGSEALREAVRPLAGADGVLLETWSSPAALDAADRLAAWPETRRLPVILSLTYRRHFDGQLLTQSGHAPEWFARRVRDHGVAVLGVNCGRDVGPDQVVEILKRYREETDLPLLARPNAGTPAEVEGRWVYPLTPEGLASRVTDFVAAGAALIGGCCGVGPEHIAACRDALNRGT